MWTLRAGHDDGSHCAGGVYQESEDDGDPRQPKSIKASEHADHDAAIGVRTATGGPGHTVALGRSVEGGSEAGLCARQVAGSPPGRSVEVVSVEVATATERELAAGAEPVLPSDNGCWMGTEECEIVGCVPRLRCRTTRTCQREGSVHSQSDKTLQSAQGV